VRPRRRLSCATGAHFLSGSSPLLWYNVAGASAFPAQAYQADLRRVSAVALGEVRAMSRSRKTRWHDTAFTLIELLVVVAIIALLISILLPSLQRARDEAQAVVCMSNDRQIVLALAMYQQEHNGYVPGNLWSEAAWWVLKSDLWFYKLVPQYASNPDVLICPADPFGDMFDFDAWYRGVIHMSGRVPSCGYGMNYLLRHFREPHSFNIERYAPSRPEETILLAEVGPDDEIRLGGLYGGIGSGGGTPWRDGGRLVWDDGARPWYQNRPTWLTARHRGTAIMAAMDMSVKRVPTVQVLESPIEPVYGAGHPLGDCQSGDCYFCNYHSAADATHYNFSRSKLYWWTGPYPDYPR
jgi:prepilin-type N-terminal cleavage/methylation domain-containing protein